MHSIPLDPGIYTNIFPIEVPLDPVNVMTARRDSFQDLRPLRQQLKKAWVYADQNTVYGYGPDAASLQQQGFQTATVRLIEAPRLATRVIIDGILSELTKEGYKVLSRKGRLQVYDLRPYGEIHNGDFRVYRGYDLRAIFWKDPAADQPVFGLIVDIVWLLRDKENQPLNMHQIRQKFGQATLIAIGQVQGEYLPKSNKLNTEVARQRLQEHILPFVEKYQKFDLPCGGQAKLLSHPVRVILGGEVQ